MNRGREIYSKGIASSIPTGHCLCGARQEGGLQGQAVQLVAQPFSEPGVCARKAEVMTELTANSDNLKKKRKNPEKSTTYADTENYFW